MLTGGGEEAAATGTMTRGVLVAGAVTAEVEVVAKTATEA